MKPQTGSYQIKFKINEISNSLWGNIIGIVTENGRITIENDEKSYNNFD